MLVLYQALAFCLRLFPRRGLLALASGLSHLLKRCPIGSLDRTLNVIRSRQKALGMPVSNFRETKQRNLYYTFKNLIDFFQFVDRHPQRFFRCLECDDASIERLMKLREQKQGVLVWSLHWGNWEVGPLLLQQHGISLGALHFEQLNSDINTRVNRIRQKAGVRLFHQRKELRAALRYLSEGGFLATLGDQDGTRAGCFLEFMGLVVSFPRSSELFLRKTGASLVPIYCAHQGDGYRMHVLEPVAWDPQQLRDSPEGLHRSLAAKLESMILQEPEQWLLLYDRFKLRHESRLREWDLLEFCQKSFAMAYEGKVPPKPDSRYQKGRI